MERMMGNYVIAIDDEPDFLAIVRRTADSVGFEAEVTSDPTVFKEAIRSRLPSLVLLDLQMPDCDGIELLRFLADEKCAAKIVLMSGVDARLLSHAKGMGEELRLDMGESMQKPIRPAELRKLFGKHRGKSYEVDAIGLRRALDEEHLELHYHPLVDLRSSKVVGLEALVRWNHPDYGLIMPDRFISIAEKMELINPLTDRVVELAITQLGAWCREGRDFFVSINLSAANVVDGRLPDRLASLCSRHEVPTRQVCFELTETAAMGNPVLMLEVLTRLRLKGFKLAMDDFGTGYSSLLQLHRLPFSELKIDQSFVRKMMHSKECRVIVGAVISLAHALDLELIAEGVETAELVEKLADLGCQTGQGYHFAKPMPAGQVTGWLDQHSPSTL